MHTLPSLGSQLPVVGFCAQAESAGNWGPSIEAAVIPLAVWFPLMWSMLWSVSQSSCWTTCGDLYHAGLVCWWVLSPRHFDPSFPKEPFSWMEMVWVVITSCACHWWVEARLLSILQYIGRPHYLLALAQKPWPEHSWSEGGSSAQRDETTWGPVTQIISSLGVRKWSQLSFTYFAFGWTFILFFSVLFLSLSF